MSQGSLPCDGGPTGVNGSDSATMRDLDRYRLYEQCTQSADEQVPLLVAIHGGSPRALGEDFCGAAALSLAWVRQIPGGRAIAVDHDPEPLARVPRLDAIEVVRGDVRADTSPGRHRCDVIHVGNFSICAWRTRPDLLAYLRHARARLDPGGILACDLYGGESAFLVGETEDEHPLPGGRLVRYTWEQREADAATGLVVNAMHFRIERDGVVEREMRDAFVYRWRLWGVPELRDAMAEAGFETTEVYAKVPDAVDDEGRVFPHRVDGPDDLDDSFDVLVVGRHG